jgi:hypothetical protein
MFHLYNINVWLGKIDSNTNKLRLKTYILQLLGGFSKLNMLEKLERSQNEHYVLSDKNFMNIKKFGKAVLNLENLNKIKIFMDTILENLTSNFVDQVGLTEKITSNLDSILIGGKQGIIEDPFYDCDSVKFNPMFTESGEIDILKSNEDFKLNYKFNLLLIFILSLEVLIKLTYNVLKKLNYPSDKPLGELLTNFLVTLIINYTQSILIYIKEIETYKNYYKFDIPSDFPFPFNPDSNSCYCDHSNKRTNTLNLIFSEIKIDLNLYSSPELNAFCSTKCLNSNSIYSQNKNKNNDKDISTYQNNKSIDNNRKYSTLINKNKIIVRKFSSFSYLNKVQDKTSNKEINYNKSIFSILEKIKELTKDNYDPKKVQLAIENI